MSEDASASTLTARLVEAGAGSVRAVLLYGSRLLGARPDPYSAYDLVVVVGDYRAFHAALAAAGELHRPVWLMTALARVLAPNTLAFAPEEGREGIAKCLVVSVADLERALGTRPRDHFLLGRLVQRVETVWAATPEDARRMEELLDGARAGVLRWMAPWLTGSFDAASLGRRMLDVLYRGEVRPEAKDRAERIFEAQAEHFRRALGPVLERAAASGILLREGERYRLAKPPGAFERLRWRLHFARSKTRATLRWFKHMVTFANWLPYIVRKVERHTGRPVHLTPLERRLPIIFLWPRAIRVLRSRPRREIRP
ncbi:MAG TPA: hypothetical protein VFQ22_03885 [Longimicrobiales bacterium]|nr:hypothetical protein [Longimicrobiales bacterium]